MQPPNHAELPNDDPLPKSVRELETARNVETRQLIVVEERVTVVEEWMRADQMYLARLKATAFSQARSSVRQDEHNFTQGRKIHYHFDEPEKTITIFEEGKGEAQESRRLWSEEEPAEQRHDHIYCATKDDMASLRPKGPLIPIIGSTSCTSSEGTSSGSTPLAKSVNSTAPTTAQHSRDISPHKEPTTESHTLDGSGSAEQTEEEEPPTGRRSGGNWTNSLLRRRSGASNSSRSSMPPLQRTSSRLSHLTDALKRTLSSSSLGSIIAEPPSQPSPPLRTMDRRLPGESCRTCEIRLRLRRLAMLRVSLDTSRAWHAEEIQRIDEELRVATKIEMLRNGPQADDYEHLRRPDYGTDAEKRSLPDDLCKDLSCCDEKPQLSQPQRAEAWIPRLSASSPCSPLRVVNVIDDHIVRAMSPE